MVVFWSMNSLNISKLISCFCILFQDTKVQINFVFLEYQKNRVIRILGFHTGKKSLYRLRDGV